MPKLSLTRLEIQDLINRYKSELRKLQYQIEKTTMTVRDLEAALEVRVKEAPILETGISTTTSTSTETTTKPTGKRRGRPKKSTAEKTSNKKPTTGKKRGRPPGKKKAGSAAKKKASVNTTKKAGRPGRKSRLSEWDEFVLACLKAEKKAMINKDFLDHAKDEMGDGSLSEGKIKTKLNQSLHKLANKKNMVEKVSYSGRGFAYALPEWMGDSNVLKNKFRR